MFDFFQAIFAKITSFVVGVVMATGLVPPPTAQPLATSTEQVALEVIQEESATSSQSASDPEGFGKETKEDEEDADLKAEAERLRAERDRAEAARAKADAARAKAEQIQILNDTANKLQSDLEKTLAEEEAKKATLEKEKREEETATHQTESETNLAEQERMKKIDEIQKEYLLKINALEKQLLELGFFDGRERDIIDIYEKYMYSVPEEVKAGLGYIPSKYQLSAVTRIYVAAENRDKTLVQDKHYSLLSAIKEALGSVKREVRDEINFLQNEKDRKILEA
ncbi:hypothetical protein C4556_02185 [Candidatus Parcubacteria bacterium]|nr:MAG: hypothetical protein C4556_02185 [Candidatus Parcubacteria bacterium]